MLKRPRALLFLLALTGLVAVGVLISTVLKLWGPWPPSNLSAARVKYWGGFGGVIWAGLSVLLACVAITMAARPKRNLHYVLILVISAAMAGLGIGTGALWEHAGIHDCRKGFCRIAVAVLALSDILFALWVLSFGLALFSMSRPDEPAVSYSTTTERVSREKARETPDTSVGKSSVNPTMGVPVLNSDAPPVPTSPLPPPPGLSSSPPSRTAALRDTISTLRSHRTRGEDTSSTTASLIPYLSPYDLAQLEGMQPGRGRSMDTTRERRGDSMEEEAPFEVKNVSFGRKSNSSAKKSRKPLDGLW